MSFSGRKRPFYPSSLTMLLIISLVHVLVSSQCQVGAIRSFPQRLLQTGKNQTQIFQGYFNGRVSDLNTPSTNATFRDNKRVVPSCPDPLHN
ncbi:hypothetical protein ACS0TY_008327 [Phlomoides rotata]